MIDERTFGFIYGASFDQLTEEEGFLDNFLSDDKTKRILSANKLKKLIKRKISNQQKLWDRYRKEGL